MSTIRPENAPDRSDPFLMAVRYGDADVQELGLDEAIAKVGLDRDVLEYVAEQRALRIVLGQSGRADEIVAGTAPELSDADHALIDGLVPMFIDALLAGWRAKAIVDADERNAG